MIKRNNKKGFTIVELVIVIAVIAILAAVLIPTFAGIIKKANISADTQLAKSLNTILVSEEAEGNKPANFSEVLAILRENGYVVENLNPTTEGCYFVWESASNQIMLVDKDFQIIYVAEELTENTAICETWFFAVRDEASIAAIKEKNGSVVPAVDTAWLSKDGKDGENIKNLLKDGGVVTLNEAVTITTAPLKADGTTKDGIRIEDGQTVDFNLAGQTMTANFETTNYRVFQVAVGTLNISDGNLVVSATEKDNGDPGLWGVAYVGYGGKATLNMENMNVVYSTDATPIKPATLFVVTSQGELFVKDSTFTFSNAIGAEICGTATFENVTFKAAGDGTWADICVSASLGGTANIKSGTYIAATGGDNTGYSVGVLTTGGTLNISGGTFEGCLFIGNDHAETSVDSVINITGGTFDGKAFSSLTEAEWLTKLGDSYGTSTVEITGAGTNNVTIKVAK